jgi:hypothetical protein
MKRRAQWGLSVLLLALITVQPAFAFRYPLSSSAIREAYFLGSGDPNKRLEFFEKYTKRYPVAKSGQYVASIFFETPYVLIAENVSQRMSNYSAPDAVKDYLGKPTVCRIRVEIYFGISNVSPSRYQANYDIRLKQHDKGIQIKRKWFEQMVSADDSTPFYPGEYLTGEYSADDIDSEAPATVEIIAPDGNNVSETFDLDSLR